MPSPPYSPGGRLIEWISARSIVVPGGRGPKFGDGHRRAETHQPSSQAARPPRGPSLSFADMVGHADAQARHAIAHLPQRQPQARAGGGAVEAMALQRTHEDVALHGV